MFTRAAGEEARIAIFALSETTVTMVKLLAAGAGEPIPRSLSSRLGPPKDLGSGCELRCSWVEQTGKVPATVEEITEGDWEQTTPVRCKFDLDRLAFNFEDTLPGGLQDGPRQQRRIGWFAQAIMHDLLKRASHRMHGILDRP